MPTSSQKTAARTNIKRAQAVWRDMTGRQRSLAQPQSRGRAKPGEASSGSFYRIVVRPKDRFSVFRVQQVGRSGHTERLAGKRRSGSWDTQAWLISKQDSHIKSGQLVIDDPKAKTVLKQIRRPIVRQKGDIFAAKPRRNIPERAKPTVAQRRAQVKNIKKAQAARRR